MNRDALRRTLAAVCRPRHRPRRHFVRRRTGTFRARFGCRRWRSRRCAWLCHRADHADRRVAFAPRLAGDEPAAGPCSRSAPVFPRAAFRDLDQLARIHLGRQQHGAGDDQSAVDRACVLLPVRREAAALMLVGMAISISGSLLIFLERQQQQRAGQQSASAISWRSSAAGVFGLSADRPPPARQHAATGLRLAGLRRGVDLSPARLRRRGRHRSPVTRCRRISSRSVWRSRTATAWTYLVQLVAQARLADLRCRRYPGRTGRQRGAGLGFVSTSRSRCCRDGFVLLLLGIYLAARARGALRKQQGLRSEALVQVDLELHLRNRIRRTPGAASACRRGARDSDASTLQSISGKRNAR